MLFYFAGKAVIDTTITIYKDNDLRKRNLGTDKESKLFICEIKYYIKP